MGIVNNAGTSCTANSPCAAAASVLVPSLFFIFSFFPLLSALSSVPVAGTPNPKLEAKPEAIDGFLLNNPMDEIRDKILFLLGADGDGDGV